jgi:ribosomal protein RSM22 (predicted rRNA methylase)
LKKAELSYEDEKYSYLIFSREPLPAALSRIIRRPQINAGFVKLTLCGANEITQETFTKRDKATFKAARKIHWGDRWP